MYMESPMPDPPGYMHTYVWLKEIFKHVLQLIQNCFYNNLTGRKIISMDGGGGLTSLILPLCLGTPIVGVKIYAGLLEV